MSDRDYYYWFVTFTGIGKDPDPEAILDALLARAERSSPLVRFAGHEIYRDVGRVSLETQTAPVRAWEYCAIAELDRRTDMAGLLADPPPVLAGADWSADGACCLSSEITLRPEGAGTAVPRPLPGHPHLPKHFTAAVEYIQIPDDRWTEYKTFMRDVFGPIGCWLVENGHSHKIVITERVRSFFHDSSMPAWNRIHILTGDFDSARGDFIDRTAEAVRAVIGPSETIASAMKPANAYRRKPKMSKNEVVRSKWPPPDEA